MVISKTDVAKRTITSTTSASPYSTSTLIQKLRTRLKSHKPLRIAFLDIDATMTGNTETTNETRKELERLGYAIVYVTARTEEMIMSSPAYELSMQEGFDRPVPLLGTYRGKRVYTQPELIVPAGILDPDIIAGSTGTQILVKELSGAYRADTAYENTFNEDSKLWKSRMLELVNAFNKNGKRAFLSPLEDEENYTNGIVDVAPQKYRLGVVFQSNHHKQAFRAFIKQMRSLTPEVDFNLRIIDDSNPKKELFLLVLTPKNASKRGAVDQIIDNICVEIKVKRADLQVLIAGDNYPDIDMGIKGAKGTNATFILAGGSQLAHALTCAKKHEETFDEHFQEIKAYLHARKEKGYYQHKLFANHDIIVCDEVCKGKIAAESILSLLAEVA